MAIDHVDQTIVTRQPTVVAAPESVPTPTSQETVRTESRHLTRSGAATAAGPTVTGVDLERDRSRSQHGTYHG